jgi:hypothetical protein
MLKIEIENRIKTNFMKLVYNSAGNNLKNNYKEQFLKQPDEISKKNLNK